MFHISKIAHWLPMDFENYSRAGSYKAPLYTVNKFFHDHCSSEHFLCLIGFLTSLSTTRLYPGRAPRLTSDKFYVLPHTRQLGDRDFCLSRSHYTDTNQTSRERAATAGIKPGTSSPRVKGSTD